MLSSICFMPASLTPQSLPPLVPTMSMYFSEQHGRDVHAGRVVPDEEGLVGLLGIVAVEEVDHVGGNFLVHRFRALERERTFILARLVLRRAVGGLHPKTGRGGVMQVPVFGSTSPGGFGIPGIGIVVHGGQTACVVGLLLMSGKLTCCMASR